MTYLRPPVIGNFKSPIDPNKPKKERAASRRPGMDPQHVKNVASLSSCISGKKPCDPHHLYVKIERGVGLKATDQWCVPLTRDEHIAVTLVGSRNELTWFKRHGIENPYELAKALWRVRGDLDAMEKIVQANRATPEPTERSEG